MSLKSEHIIFYECTQWWCHTAFVCGTQLQCICYILKWNFASLSTEWTVLDCLLELNAKCPVCYNSEFSYRASNPVCDHLKFTALYPGSSPSKDVVLNENVLPKCKQIPLGQSTWIPKLTCMTWSSLLISTASWQCSNAVNTELQALQQQKQPSVTVSQQRLRWTSC